MPYKSISDLPKSVRDNLPASAQRVYKNAYNDAAAKNIANPSRYAWGAVKKAFKKGKDGKWVKKLSSGPAEITNDEFIFEMPGSPAGWARLYFQISPEEWEILDEDVRNGYIEQIPAMLEDTTKKLSALTTHLYHDEPTASEKIQWMREDISSLWSKLYDVEEDADDKYEMINKRIDDLLAVITGMRRLAELEAGTITSTNSTSTTTGNWSVKTPTKLVGYLIKAAEPLRWHKSGEVLKIEGTLIAEGVWTGIDGQTVFYPRTIFPGSAQSIVSQAIKRGHYDDDNSVIGFVTAAAVSEDRINIEGIIFDRDTISDVALGTLGGISMEADVHAEYSEERGCWIATSMDLLKATLVENPACEPCKVGTLCTIALAERPEEVKEKRKIGKMSIELENPLFTDVVAILETAEVENTVTLKVLELLRKAVKAQANAKLTETIEELKGKLTAKDTEIEELKEQIEEKDTQLGSKETEHTDALGEKDEEIEKLSTELKGVYTAEVNALLAQIKEIDKEFDEKDLVEGVEDLTRQKTLLSKYLAAATKLAKTVINVNDTNAMETRVSAALESMGITNVKNFIEKGE